VAAGVPVLSDENFEGSITLGRSLVPAGRNLFALRVRGDSMIGKGIFDNDMVLVKSQQVADSGQIVVALVDGEATVKTFRRLKDHIRLEPANEQMEPIVVHRQDFKPTCILGVVTGVYRQI
jgi:repressor LexA